MAPVVSFEKKKTVLDKAHKGEVTVRNNSHEPLTICLEILGNAAFRLEKKDRQVTLKPGQVHAIPVEFVPKTGNGWPIARSVRYEALVRVWNQSRTHLIDTAVIRGTGPAFVPVLHCLTKDIKPSKKEISHSPPAISLETVIPGTSIPANTDTVEVNWSVDGADEIRIGQGGPGAEVLAEGMVTDWGSWSGPPSSSDHGSFTYTPGSTISADVYANNADGYTSKTEIIYQTANFGYHSSRTPAGGSIYESELAQVRRYLEQAESAIRTDRLVHLADFIERWNAVAPPGYQVPALDDMAYLSGAVGSGTLADDMLSAMQSMLVYLKPYTLPRGYRPGTITDPSFHTLCEEYACNGHTCTAVGKTIWHDAHPERSWLGICLEIGADDLTLLHEIYHYTTHRYGDTEEMKATVISCCCYDYIPF